jgi:hypothetical protein
MGMRAGQRSRRASRVAVALAVTAIELLGAGCGGTSEQAAGGSTTRTAPPVPRTSYQLAGAVLMAASDLSAQWRPTPPTPPANCGRTGWERAEAHRGTPSYRLQYSSIQQNVAVFATANDAERVFAALRTRRSDRCFFRSLLRGVETRGAEQALSSPEVVREGGERHADETRYAIPAESKLGRVTVYADRVRVQTGRVISVLVMIGLESPFEEALSERVVGHVRSRMHGVDQHAAA